MPYSKTVKVLIIDDDEDDYFIISDYIRSIAGATFAIDWCRDYGSALKQIGENSHDIYFIDYRLGAETGLTLLEEAKSLGCDSPIVLLTGKGNREIDLEAMRKGATDYLDKSELNSEKLDRCIRYSLDHTASLRALRQSENKYRNLFESSRDALFIADNGLQFTEVNEAATSLFGVDEHALIGDNLFNFISNDSEKGLITKFLAPDDNFAEMEVDIVAHDKQVRTCILSVSLQKNEQDHQFVHGILHDISNMKEAEKINIHAQKLAANERLVRILAHEIRNPLNNIRLSADHLKVPNEKEKGLVSIIQRNSIRINQIITELLDSTKLADLVFERHALQDILDESLSNAMDRINLQKVTVHKSYTEIPIVIIGDKPKLKIAFNNILINAIEAMEPEKGQLEIGIHDKNEKVAVSVKDNGKGIAKEHLSKLFEPFFTMKKNGMGLGLSSAYSIIQSHKGTLQVESETNQGTKFIIHFAKAE